MVTGYLSIGFVLSNIHQSKSIILNGNRLPFLSGIQIAMAENVYYHLVCRTHPHTGVSTLIEADVRYASRGHF